jgi:hypothetical protein
VFVAVYRRCVLRVVSLRLSGTLFAPTAALSFGNADSLAVAAVAAVASARSSTPAAALALAALAVHVAASAWEVLAIYST